MTTMTIRSISALLLISLNNMVSAQTEVRILLKNVTVIDGTGALPKPGTDVLISGNRILKVQSNIQDQTARKVDLTGKTMIPSLICAHAHVGTLKGKTSAAENYTRENILRQLKKYQDYGVSAILTLGTDRPLIFENGLRDSTVAGLLPGARLFSAGYGFNTPDKSPGSWMNLLKRPETVEDVKPMMDDLAKLKPTAIKIWVDDHGGNAQKMKPEIYKAIISEAHRYGIRVAAHLFYKEDAKLLVEAGLDIIAHSIRDQVADDELLKLMRKKGVIYIPTLSLDTYNYIYGDKPNWIGDAFFQASLEPGVMDMITSADYQSRARYSPDYEKSKRASETARVNLKKMSDAGVLIALGTDSGAFPIRTQGFTEHLEMELMVQAGLSPMQAITISTKNAARALRIDKEYGTIENGKIADFIILNDNPQNDITSTRKIESVWKAGKQVSTGPLANKN
jgi:imidazolonepropionase-like amidohydrolase